MNSDSKLLFFCFVLPAIVSLVFGATTVELLHPNSLGFNNIFVDTIGRLLNLITLIILTYFALNYQSISNSINDNGQNVIRFYWYGCFTALIFCLWQFVSFYVGIIPFPFYTRSFVHSSGNLKLLVPGRITGIASEPSYIVPILFDFIILTQMLAKGKKKSILTYLGLLCLFFTFSGSAGLEILIFLGFWGIYFVTRILNNKFNKIELVLFLCCIIVVVCSVCIFFANSDTLLSLYIVRFTRIMYSGRFLGFILPFEASLESNIINIIFGHGTKSYILLSNRYPDLIDNVTSNSLYADFYWEYGLFGLSGFILFIVIKSIKLRKFNLIDNKTICALLIHLFSTGFYRSDYASLRFFVILIIISVLSSKNKLMGWYEL